MLVFDYVINALTLTNLRASVMKLFWHTFTLLFCKLDHLINICNICCIAMKRSSLNKGVSKFMPKMFDENKPWPLSNLKASPTLVI